MNGSPAGNGMARIRRCASGEWGSTMTSYPLPARIQRRAATAHLDRPGLIMHPKLLVADEPFSALDVSIHPRSQSPQELQQATP
jgi:ABC-type uncharacterized transport system YnjBCD ATPase subunit